MTEYNAGDAKLRIIPDAKGFKAELEAQLKSEKEELLVRVKAELAQAREEVDKFRAEQEARNLKMRATVDRHSSGSDFESAAGDMADKFEKAFATRMGAIGVGLFPGLVTAVAELVGVFDQLGGATVALPGIFAGAASSLSTFAVGVHGVVDAYTALTAAAKDATQNARQHAQEVVSAENSVRNAVSDEVMARRDQSTAYREARQNLQDLNVELRGGQISEAQAVLDAQKARQDLYTGHFKTLLDLQQQQLRVVASDQRIAEVHQHNIDLQGRANDAQAKGVEGSDRVLSANQRMVRSQEAMQSAVFRLNELLNFGTQSQRAAAYAMSLLAPEAQSFVRTLNSLRPEILDQFIKPVQNNLFSGMSGEIRNLVNADLPLLRTGFGSIATSINHDLTRLFGALENGKNQTLFDRIFGNTAQAQERLKYAIDPIVHAFAQLSATGSDSLPRLADGLGKAADRFDQFISAAAQDGRLDKWINAGLTGFTELGNIFIHLGQSVHGITAAIGGEGLLAMLDHGVAKMSEWINSLHGQNTLRQFFEEGRNELHTLVPILENLGPIFVAVWKAAKDATEVYLPILQTVTKLLADNPGLVKGVVDAYLTWKTIGPILDVIKIGIGGIGDLTAAVGTGFYSTRQKAQDAAAGIDAEFKAAGKEESGLGKFSSKVASFGVLAGPFGALATGVATIAVPALLELMNKTNDATASAKALTDQEKALRDTLDSVTNIAGLQTRKKVSDEFQNFPGQDGGLTGNVLNAAASIGIGGPGGVDLVSSVLPGGEGLANSNMAKVRGIVAPAVRDIMDKYDPGTRDALAKVGITDDVVVDAYLGNRQAIDKFRTGLAAAKNANPDQPINFDLGSLGSHIKERGGDVLNAAIVGQATNFEQYSTGSAVGTARQAQQATVAQPHLLAAYTNQFGADAVVNTDGRNTTILSHQAPTPAQVDAAKKSGTTIDPPIPPGNQWTWHLSGDDARKYTYEHGGPTPGSAGPLSGGGYPAIMHPDEYVISSRGRSQVPDSFLHALNKGLVDPRALPHFDDGGPGDGNLAYSPGGQAPGPAAGSAPAGPGGILSSLAGAGGGGNLGASNLGSLSFFGLNIPLGGIANRFNPAITNFQDPNGTPNGITPTTSGPLGPQVWPGLWGLGQIANIQDPAAQDAARKVWHAQNTKELIKLGTSGLSGIEGIYGSVLGSFGLDKSILSPNNPYTRAGTTGAGYYLGQLFNPDQSSPYSGTNADVQQLLSGNNLPTSGQTDPLVAANASGPASSSGGPAALTSSTSGGAPSSGQQGWFAPALSFTPGQWTALDALAASRFHLAMTSGYRDPGGATIAGVPASKSYHGQMPPNGRAHDYGGSAADRLAFANFMADNYGSSLKELIYSAPGFTKTIKDGRVVGPFGSFYTLDQAGDHSDHVHIAYDQGGWLLPGLTMAHNETGKPEAVLTHDQGKAVQALGDHAAKAPQPQPGPSTTHGDHAGAPPGPPPGPSTHTQVGELPAGVAGAPKSQEHNAPGVQTGITSAATAIGNAASIAASAAGVGIPGAGAAGPAIAGLVQQGGKIAAGAVNVLSSFLVGNATSPGKGSPYGQTFRPQQNVPQTVPMRGGTNIESMTVADPFEMRRALDIHDAQQQQSFLVNKSHW